MDGLPWSSFNFLSLVLAVMDLLQMKNVWFSLNFENHLKIFVASQMRDFLRILNERDLREHHMSLSSHVSKGIYRKLTDGIKPWFTASCLSTCLTCNLCETVHICSYHRKTSSYWLPGCYFLTSVHSFSSFPWHRILQTDTHLLLYSFSSSPGKTFQSSLSGWLCF